MTTSLHFDNLSPEALVAIGTALASLETKPAVTQPLETKPHVQAPTEKKAPEVEKTQETEETQESQTAAQGWPNSGNNSEAEKALVSEHENTNSNIGPIGKGGIDLNTADKEGLVWDARIHSSNQKQTAKGVWVKKKGVTVDIINQVKAEMTTGTPAPMKSVFEDGNAAGLGNAGEAFGNNQQPAVVDFQSFLVEVTGRTTDAQKGAAFTGRMMEILASHRIAAIPMLQNCPQLIPTVKAELDGAWNAL